MGNEITNNPAGNAAQADSRQGGILVDISDHSGYGDIIAGLNIVRTLLDDGIQPYVGYSQGQAAGKFTEVASREVIQSVEQWWEGAEDDLISITPVQDGRDDGKVLATDTHIGLSEYDKTTNSPTQSAYGGGKYDILVRTGLAFSPMAGDVQAGIYHDVDIDSMLQELEQGETQVEALREETVDQLLESGSDEAAEYLQQSRDELLESDWSFAYKSSIGTLATYFDMIQAAEDKLDRPLYIFAVGKGAGAAEAEKRGWSLYNFITDRMTLDSERRDSPVSIVNLDTIPNQQFKRLNALSDTLSLVTGDHSFSQALQTAGSDLSAPFVYQCANWKQNLAENMANLMQETSEDAAALFRGYIEKANADPGSRYGTTTPLKDPKDLDLDGLAHLVYDESLQEEYNEAMANVERYFIEQRREAGIDEPELLWSVNDTIRYLVDGLRDGVDEETLFRPLLPDQYLESHTPFADEPDTDEQYPWLDTDGQTQETATYGTPSGGGYSHYQPEHWEEG